MKKKLTIAALVLAVSAVGGSAYAASDSKVGATIKAGVATLTSSISSTDNSAADVAKLDGKITTSTEATSLEQLAKEKGITVKELLAQLEKEGKLLKATPVTDSTATEVTSELKDSSAADVAKLDGKITTSTEATSLEELAKEKGITVKELLAQLEKEGKLLKSTPVTDSAAAESNKK